jgi:hypothetical protein
MNEIPERIWAMAPGLGYNRLLGTYVDRPDQEDRTEYIRADLVEAAIKRALDAAANVCGRPNGPWKASAWECRDDILSLDPAQFIEGDKT